eukprot:2949442-Amphidinium_carterae.1
MCPAHGIKLACLDNPAVVCCRHSRYTPKASKARILARRGQHPEYHVSTILSRLWTRRCLSNYEPGKCGQLCSLRSAPPRR